MHDTVRAEIYAHACISQHACSPHISRCSAPPILTTSNHTLANSITPFIIRSPPGTDRYVTLTFINFAFFFLIEILVFSFLLLIVLTFLLNLIGFARSSLSFLAKADIFLASSLINYLFNFLIDNSYL